MEQTHLWRRDVEATQPDIAKAIMTDKRMDMEDADLVKRTRWSVTDARRRAAARGV